MAVCGGEVDIVVSMASSSSAGTSLVLVAMKNRDTTGDRWWWWNGVNPRLPTLAAAASKSLVPLVPRGWFQATTPPTTLVEEQDEQGLR